MDSQDHEAAEREQRLQEALVAYLEALEADRAPEAEELLARYPEFTDELAEFLANRDQIDQLAAPLRQAVEVAQRTIVNDAPTLAPGTTLPPQVGTSIRYFGEYELLEEIARGGMGVVFRARQTTLKRIVALKMILSGQLAGEEEVKRFYAEAEAAAKLDHPNIVPIFEIGQHEGQHYFSMSFIEGESLAHKVADGPVAPREAAELVKKIAVAIAYAHAEGVIHRDLKPGNVLVDRDGEPRITDFGLAKRVEGDSSLTATGQVVGTPSYMPPEQARGELDEVGPLADIYATGAVLYCLLTARPPFQAANPLDTLLQVLEKDPLPVQDLVPQVPRDLETICLKCLEKEPRRRYGSAGEFAEDLQRFLNGGPVRARPIGRPARVWRWCKRKPALASLIVALATTFLGGFVGVTSQWIRAENNAAAAQKQELQTRRYLYVAQMNLAQQAWDQANIPRVLQLLDFQRPRPGQVDLRGFDWHYRWRLCHSDLFTMQAQKSGIQSVAYSGDDKHLATASYDGTLKLWDVATRQEIASLQVWPAATPRGSWARFLLSPNGVFLAAAKESEVAIWDVAGRKKVASLEGLAKPVTCLAFSPDGRILATGQGSGDQREPGIVTVWDSATGKERGKFQGHTHWVSSVAVARDGNTVASCDASGAVKLWPLASAGEPRQFTVGFGASCLSFSPDGATLAVASSGPGALEVWNVLGKTKEFALVGHTQQVLALQFSPTGDLLASASADRTVRVWDARTGKLRNSLRGHLGPVSALTFTPDGKTLVSGGAGQVKFWDPLQEQGRVTIEGQRRIAFSPDSTTLASISGNRSVKLWDVTPGNISSALKRPVLRATISHGQAGVTSIAFSADGGTLASGSTDKTVKLWDTIGGSLRATLQEAAAVRALAFSPDRRTLAIGLGTGEVKLRDVATRETRLAFSAHKRCLNYSIVFSPDGQTLATAGGFDNSCKLWRASDGVQLSSVVRHTDRVVSIAFSPDGRMLATGSFDKTAKLFDVVNRKELCTLPGHTGYVMSVAFSPDGKTLATGTFDRTVRLWDVATGESVATFEGAHPPVVFSPDGKMLATGDALGVRVQLWHAATEEDVLAEIE